VEQACIPQMLSFLGFGVAHGRKDIGPESKCQYDYTAIPL
jgi:hypothetical protein